MCVCNIKMFLSGFSCVPKCPHQSRWWPYSTTLSLILFSKGGKRTFLLFFFRVIFRACQSPCASSTSPSTQHIYKRSYIQYMQGYIELEPVWVRSGYYNSWLESLYRTLHSEKCYPFFFGWLFSSRIDWISWKEKGLSLVCLSRKKSSESKTSGKYQ